MFRTTNEGHGFQITFANGYTVSVQFGAYTYCSNKLDEHAPSNCRNAEVALIHPDGWLIDLSDKISWWDSSDNVNGYTTPDQLAELIAYATSLPSK